MPTIAVDGHSATGGKFVKTDPTKRATFELLATFVTPNFACFIDPIITTLRINTGHEAVQSFQLVPKAEHFIDIENGSPGLNSLRIDVNGRFFRTLTARHSGGTVRIDASEAMTMENNTLTFTGEGSTGSFANIDVSDSGPKSPKEGENGMSVHAKGIWGSHLTYER